MKSLKILERRISNMETHTILKLSKDLCEDLKDDVKRFTKEHRIFTSHRSMVKMQQALGNPKFMNYIFDGGLVDYYIILLINKSFIKHLKTGKEKERILALFTQFRQYIDTITDQLMFPEEEVVSRTLMTPFTNEEPKRNEAVIVSKVMGIKCHKRCIKRLVN